MSNVKYQKTSLSRIILGFSSKEEATAFVNRAKKSRDILWSSSINPSSAYDKPWASQDGKLVNFDYDQKKNSFIEKLGDLANEHAEAAVNDLCIWAKEELGFVLKDADEGSMFFGPKD